ncbi:hypothetical protein FNF29_07422 [Cafeteria roenbergensis]|uniref:Intimal thickness related receptor IRP domain-containing protein n=1 Tax=Cafeteria roenbergensis TaxID=33653 RepID=A0A5A8C3Q9_CAFRO|nr:hypothetical protein FNF29_07422 [Cafeteria roenbergensis]|eukprot:KAA0147354.1 hypothetical protein FNF29_07422 [Cafeteria roenbergensis]
MPGARGLPVLAVVLLACSATGGAASLRTGPSAGPCATANVHVGAAHARSTAEDISTPVLNPSTGLPVWFRNVTVSRTVGFPPYSVVMTVADLVAPLPDSFLNSSSANGTANSSVFVPPEDFQERAVPSQFGTPRLVYMPHFRPGVTPPVTCDVLHAERVLEDVWQGVFVVKSSQELVVLGCVGQVPVTMPTRVSLRVEEYAGTLPLVITWSVGSGIGAVVVLLLSRGLRRGLVPVYDFKAQFIVLVRVVVAPLYFLMLIDLWQANAGWVADTLAGVYVAGAAIVVGVGQWWVHPRNIAAAGVTTAPSVQGWAWSFRARNVVVVCTGVMGAHMLASLWSGLMGLRMFQAPGGIWRRVPLLDLSLVTVLLMDGPVIAAATYTLVRDEADVFIPLSAWPVAVAAGGAILVEFIMALAAPLAADEAVQITRLTALYAMRREIQWIRRKDKEREAAERKAARERARLAVSGGAVEAEEAMDDGATTVVRKVGVVAPSRGLAVDVDDSAAVRPTDGKGMGGRDAPAAVEEALAFDAVEGVGPEQGGELGLALDEGGGYAGALKPIPYVPGVRRDAVVYMRSVGHQAVTVPGVPRPDRVAGRGALRGGELDDETGLPALREEGVWGGNGAMEVVGRPITPPEERRRRARKDAERAARKARRTARREARRQALLGQLTGRIEEAVLTARSRESGTARTARGEGGGIGGRGGGMKDAVGLADTRSSLGSGMGSRLDAPTARSDFTTGGLMTLRSEGPLGKAGAASRESEGGKARASATGRSVSAAPSARRPGPQPAAEPAAAGPAAGTGRSASTGPTTGSSRFRSVASSRRSTRSALPATGRTGDNSATGRTGPSTTRGTERTGRSDSLSDVSEGTELASSSRLGLDTGRSPLATGRASSGAGPTQQQRWDPDDEAATADVVTALRAKRRDAAARRVQHSGHGIAGGAPGRILHVPSTRLVTTSQRFLTGGVGGRSGRGGHWADAKPTGTGPSFGVAPGAAPPDAASARLVALKQSVRNLV